MQIYFAASSLQFLNAVGHSNAVLSVYSQFVHCLIL